MKDAQFGALGVTQAVGFYMSLCDSPVNVRKKSAADTDYANDLRSGELIAGLLAVGVATVAAIHEGSAAPLVYSGVAIVSLTLMYEYLLRHRTILPTTDKDTIS